MGFLKGILNFVLMIILGICLMIWLGYGLLHHSVLSFEENKTMIEQTQFTEELSVEVIDRYKTKLNALSLDDEVLIQFVRQSGVGVLGYVFSEYETMPSVDVSFLKDYVIKNVAAEEAGKLYGNVEFQDVLTKLRAIPEGESITKNFEAYLSENNMTFHQEDIDKFIAVYIENKSLDDEALLEKLISEMAYEKLNLNQMNTELSLQALFDTLTEENPMTVVRGLLNDINKNIYGYLTITMVLIFLMILVLEFRVATAAIWLSLSMLIAIIPLQGIRLLNFVVARDYFTLINGMESYKDYMMQVMISKLNVYTIVVLIAVVVLFILSKVFRSRIDTKIEGIEQKSKKRYVLVRFAVFAVISLGLFLNLKAMYRYDMKVYSDIQNLSIDDFDPDDLDVTLSNLLNIEYDF